MIWTNEVVVTSEPYLSLVDDYTPEGILFFDACLWAATDYPPDLSISSVKTSSLLLSNVDPADQRLIAPGRSLIWIIDDVLRSESITVVNCRGYHTTPCRCRSRYPLP